MDTNSRNNAHVPNVKIFRKVMVTLETKATENHVSIS